MSLFNTIGQMVHAYHEMRAVARTERMISALPPEVQKDIGWPGVWEDEIAHRAGRASGTVSRR